MSADNDVMVAVKDRWDADASLPTLVPGGLRSGRLVASTATTPRAQLEVQQGPTPNQYFAPATVGKGYIDYRMVTLTVRGLKAAVETALDRVQVVFDWKTLTVSNATFLACRPIDSPRLQIEGETKSGDDVWAGVAMYEVMTQRTIT
jgi:hypothetical protein